MRVTIHDKTESPEYLEYRYIHFMALMEHFNSASRTLSQKPTKIFFLTKDPAFRTSEFSARYRLEVKESLTRDCRWPCLGKATRAWNLAERVDMQLWQAPDITQLGDLVEDGQKFTFHDLSEMFLLPAGHFLLSHALAKFIRDTWGGHADVVMTNDVLQMVLTAGDGRKLAGLL
ncbi:hypothetical protein NDU88_000794 [Pleurodeles waltl]|uniref:Uncharacterized protein n=1 Tax=Pleurodeles waltl TaxID=8319 RepID=A0AAV7LYJ9_PLEWA|nr:hypothetical protein NDU88_000794 [Pleurodeles waltl]